MTARKLYMVTHTYDYGHGQDVFHFQFFPAAGNQEPSNADVIERLGIDYGHCRAGEYLEIEELKEPDEWPVVYPPTEEEPE